LVYQNHQDTLVGIPNYTLFRRERLRGKGGGVCAYVRSSISCSVFVPSVGAQSRVNDVEILWLDCTLHDCHYFVACCYDPSKPNYITIVFLLMFCLLILLTLIVCMSAHVIFVFPRFCQVVQKHKLFEVAE